MELIKKNSHELSILQSLGLNENESILYTFLLQNPKNTVQELQNRTSFTRTMLYHILNKLVEYSLVTKTRDSWRTVYCAQSPDQLYDLLAHRQREFAKTIESVKTLIPDLKQRHHLAGRRLHVRMFEGIEGYKQALEDMILSKPEQIYAFEILT